MKQIEQAINELKLALVENLEASQAEENAKIRKMKAHYRLNKAEEAVRELKYEMIQNEKN